MDTPSMDTPIKFIHERTFLEIHSTQDTPRTDTPRNTLQAWTLLESLSKSGHS